MKKLVLLPALCLQLVLAYPQAKDLQAYFTEAKTAYWAKDYPRFYEAIREAHKLHPYHQTVLYYAGLASALTGHAEESIDYLRKAININAEYDLNSPDLKSLEGRADFTQLKKLQTELQQKVIHSDTAFVVKDRSLHVECIVPGEARNIFYLGSVHKRKVVRVDNKGNATDFITSGQDGIGSVLGVRVDTKRNMLWAGSSHLEQTEHYDSTATAGLYQYNLKTGTLMNILLPTEKKNHVFGDITLDPSGNAYASDSRNNIIFRANERTNKLEPYFTSDEFWSLQGIVFTDDGRYLFIADYVKGLYRLDTRSHALIHLTQNFDLSTKSIDGLSLYKNTLIAIQNSVVPFRVTQYKLNNTQDSLIGFTIIDRAHPAFNEPTIGCVVDNTFYYVANSLWSGYTKDNRLKPENELQDPVILKVDLRSLDR